MSNIDKQALREEFQFMRSIYSDPADHERQLIYIAAEALLDELEAKDKQIGDLKATAAHSNAGWKEAHEQEARAEAAEKRIAELEAREIVLPQPAQWDISEVLLDKEKVIKVINAAGITVKGE
ncbi:ead/Ea22-like family protein [Enterobacter asburiae]